MEPLFFVGIDTSCYTTSIAVINDSGDLIYDLRKTLEVKEGHRGLRQSEAFFQHVKILPKFFNEIGSKKILLNAKSIAVSSKPRPQDNSYMPVFLAGESIGKVLADSLMIPFISSTHQEGHLAAGLWSSKVDWNEFLAIHLSGGTTELLQVKQYGANFSIKEIGWGEDLSAGQFIDRIGVELGLSFPAGPQLEKMALKSIETLSLPVAVKGNAISFSGPETKARRLIEKGVAKPTIARAVEECIALSIIKLIKNIRDLSFQRILLVGGVMANSYIKQRLMDSLGGFELAYAEPVYARDCAVGLAEIARRKWIETKKKT